METAVLRNIPSILPKGILGHSKAMASRRLPSRMLREMERDLMSFEQQIEEMVRRVEAQQQQGVQEVASCDVREEPMAAEQAPEEAVEVLDVFDVVDGAVPPQPQPAQAQSPDSRDSSSMDESEPSVPSTSSPTVPTESGPSQSVPSGSGQSVADPSSPSSSPRGQPTASGGASPKRKAEDGQEPAGAMETDREEGPPAEKEARREERREDVEELVRLLARFRGRPVDQAMVQRYSVLPREAVQDLLDDLRYQDPYYMRTAMYMGLYSGYYPPGMRGFERRRLEELSDEDSGSETTPSTDPAMNQAKFTLDDRQRLLRLLIMGSCTQYKVQGETDPTKLAEWTQGVIPQMIQQGRGCEVVEDVKDVSVKGRSARQDGLVYALARCCRCEDIKTKRAAYAAIKDVCRTPTQLFLLINYIENLDQSSTGWGRGLRRAVQDWYNSNSNNPLRLAMQMTKYWNRHGWCHRDVCRLSHIKPVDEAIGFIIRYAVRGMKEAEQYYLEDGYMGRQMLEKVHKYLQAVEEAKVCEDAKRTVQLITEHNLVREQLRTEMLNEPEVWSVMLQNMPLMAMIRNINKMTNLGLFKDPARIAVVKEKLSNVEVMRKARVHPFKLLLAHHTYKQGRGEKGSLSWEPDPEILDALEEGFYASFGAVEPTNKRILIALDISGSMQARFMNSAIECREAATLMAMVTCKVEPHCDIVGFHHKLMELNMFKEPNKKLGDLVDETHRLGFGTTDCSKPMTWARHKQKDYDVFIIYTDSETNSQRIPPWRALQKYREKMNKPNAKLIVVAMSSYGFTIAQPGDVNMLDVVGFDTDTPDIIREFIEGSFE